MDIRSTWSLYLPDDFPFYWGLVPLLFLYTVFKKSIWRKFAVEPFTVKQKKKMKTVNICETCKIKISSHYWRALALLRAAVELFNLSAARGIHMRLFPGGRKDHPITMYCRGNLPSVRVANRCDFPLWEKKRTENITKKKTKPCTYTRTNTRTYTPPFC